MTTTARTQSARSLLVTALVRGPEPAARAAVAARRLLLVVAEWPSDAALDVILHSDTHGGVAFGIRALGAAPRGWDRDVASALDDVAVTARRRVPVPAAPTALFELVRDPARAQLHPEEPWSAIPALPDVVWPTPRPDGGDLLRALHRTPGGFVRMLVSAATPLELDMLREEMRTTWVRGLHPDFDLAFGVPLRVRTFVGSIRADSLASLRAAVRDGGAGLVLAAASEHDRARFARLDVADLAGHVRPLAWALAAVRLPAAGLTPPLGIASIDPPITPRPLEPARAFDPAAVTLGTACTAQGRPVAAQLGVADFARHAWVEGSSGSGKTTLLAVIAAALTRLGIGVTLLDPHGQGVDAALAALDADVAARAIVVRHGDGDAPTPLNIVRSGGTAAQRAKTKAEFIDFMQAYFDPAGTGIVGPRWRRWMSLLWDGVVCVFGEDATLLHIVSVASEAERTERLAKAVAVRDRELGTRIRREIVELRGDEAANLTGWAVSKFQPLVESRVMRVLIGTSADAVDIESVVAAGAPLLIDLGSTELGTTSARMLGTIWLLKHWAALGRGRRPHVVLVDEAHLYRRGPLASLLAEARKFGVGVVLAGQSINALDDQLQDAVEANVGTSISFRLGLTTAPRASARLAGWPVGELLRLPDLQAAATFSRSGVPTPPFLLTVPPSPLAPDAARRLAAERELPLLRRWRATRTTVVSDEAVERGLNTVLESATPPRRPARPRPDPLRTFEQEWLAAQSGIAPGSVSTSEDAAPAGIPTLTEPE